VTRCSGAGLRAGRRLEARSATSLEPYRTHATKAKQPSAQLDEIRAIPPLYFTPSPLQKFRSRPGGIRHEHHRHVDLAEEAVRNSLTTEEFAAKVLREHLNRQTVSNVEMVREKLRLWQEKT